MFTTCYCCSQVHPHHLRLVLLSGKKRSRSNSSTMKRHSDPKPHINPKLMRYEDMEWVREEMRERQYSNKKCEICSTSTREIRHQHFSTTNLREFALQWTRNGFMCPICHVLEDPVREAKATHRVILSDSTLYGIWDQPELPNICSHFDMECIVGGHIKDLTKSLRRILEVVKGRLEVVLVGGISNIESGDSVRTILDQIYELKEAVKLHSFHQKHRIPGYVSVATLCLPPKLCSLRLPVSLIDLEEWIPGPGFENKYPLIKQVNSEIKKMNLKDGLSYLNIHMHGVKMLKSGAQHKFDTRHGSTAVWREKLVFEKMHYTMENKMKLMKYLKNTFDSNVKEDSLGH